LRASALLPDSRRRDLPLDVTSAAAETRLAVAVPYDPVVAKALLLRASRLAGRMNTKWYALYVHRRPDHPENMPATQHRLMIENVQLAMSLGDFGRKEHIGLLVIGQPTRRGVFGRMNPGIVSQIIDQMRGFDVFVVMGRERSDDGS